MDTVDEDDLREALEDLWFINAEMRVMGGGPGWRKRYDDAFAKASAVLGKDEPRD